MEKNQETMKKKNMSIKIVTRGGGGGGLAGIILLGGALATAALVSTFAFKRNQIFKKSSKVVKEDADDELLVGEGLSFLVQDSLSPQLDHHPSNGRQDEFVSGGTVILDETSQVTGEKDEEIDILKNARESLLCDESVTGMDEFPVPFADSSLLLKPEEMQKNGQLEENAVLEVENIMMADSNQVGVGDNDQHIPLEEDEVRDGIGMNTDVDNRQLVEAALADQVGVDGKEHMPAGKFNENSEVMIEREEVLVEVLSSEKLGIDYDYHKLGDECDGNGRVLVEKRDELAEAAVVEQFSADDNSYNGGEECEADVGITIEKGEELVGDVAANQIQLSEKSEFLCSDGTIINGLANGTCDIDMTELLLPLIDSSSSLKAADNDLVENPLVIEDAEILKRGEADETAVQVLQEDGIEIEDWGRTQLVEVNEEENEIYRETTNDKWDGADEIGVENDQQMQPCEEFQICHINEDQNYSSDKSSPEINSFPCNGLEVQEFSFPLLDSQPYFNFGSLIKDDYLEKAPHVEDVNTMKQDRSANGVFAYPTMLENKPLVQLAKNDEMKSFGDGSKNDEEALEIIEEENFELENNQQSPLKEDNCYDDNVNREEVSETTKDEENSDSDSDEEDTDDGDEESSETTSLDSNAEAVWPVESLQEFSQKEKRMLANNHNSTETKRGDNFFNFNRHKLEEEDEDFSNKLTADITTLRRPTNFSNLKFWFWSLLVPFLLLLWLLLPQISSPGSSHWHIQ